MSAPIQALYYGQTGVLSFKVPYGRPDADGALPKAYATIKTAKGSDLPTAVVGDQCAWATIDTSRALAAAAAKDATTITLDATTGVVVGEPYLIDGGTSYQEWVLGKSWDSVAKVLTLWSPLERSHASGAKVQTTTVTVTLAAAQQDQQYSSNKVTIRAIINSVSYFYNFLYDVKLHKYQSDITVLDLMSYLPALQQWRWEEGPGLNRQLESGLNEMRSTLLSKGIDIDNLVNDADARLCHIWATLWVLTLGWAAKDQEMVDFRDYCKSEFLQRCDDLASTRRWLESTPQDGVLDADDGDIESRRYARRARLS